MSFQSLLRPNNSTSTTSSTRQSGFPCVWSFTNNHHRYCHHKRRYPSQLTKHHESHQFYYCLTCFVTFDTLKERTDHTRLCSPKCVTEGCPNYHQLLRHTSDDCNHPKVTSREKYSELFLLAQQKFHLEYVQDPWTFITGEDGEEALPESENEDLETTSNATGNIPTPKKDLTHELENLQIMKNTMQNIRDRSADLDEDLLLDLEHAIGSIEICRRRMRKHHETGQHLHALFAHQSGTRRPVPTPSSSHTYSDTTMLDQSFSQSDHGLDQSFASTSSSFNTPGHQGQPWMRNDVWWG